MRSTKLCALVGGVALAVWVVAISIINTSLEAQLGPLLAALAATLTVAALVLWVVPPAVYAWRTGYREGAQDAWRRLYSLNGSRDSVKP